MERADVVVIGAGLAGLQCARLIARRGWRVVLVERKKTPEEFVHTTGIFVRRTFEEFAFPAGVLGPAIRTVVVHAPSGRSATMTGDRDEFRIGRMQQLYRFMLDDAIAAGAQFRGGTSFTRLDFAADRVRVHAGGQRIDARLVVAADGASSRVAHALGLRAPDAFLTGVEAVYRVKSEPRLECFLDPDLAPGYIAWIARDGEEIHAGAAGHEHAFRGRAVFDRMRERFGEPIEIRGGRIPICGILPEIATTRGLLVGDAAGAASPLTAGGLDAAVRLAAYAAQSIDEVLEHGGSLARIYSGERFRARFLSRLWARTLFDALMNRTTCELLVAALRAGFLRNVFFGHGSFPIAAAEIAAYARS